MSTWQVYVLCHGSSLVERTQTLFEARLPLGARTMFVMTASSNTVGGELGVKHPKTSTKEEQDSPVRGRTVYEMERASAEWAGNSVTSVGALGTYLRHDFLVSSAYPSG